MTRVLLRIAVLASALLLAGCGTEGTAPSDSAEPTTSTSPDPTPSETPEPGPALAGDCTATDGDGPHIPVIYTVVTGDDTTPVTVAYTGFNRDGSLPVITEELVGPVITRIGYACVAEVSGEIWTLTATSSTPDSVGCVLAFGGKLVATDSAFNEGATTPQTADCSGNPGR